MHVVYGQLNKNLSTHNFLNEGNTFYIFIVDVIRPSLPLSWLLINSELDCVGMYCDITSAC